MIINKTTPGKEKNNIIIIITIITIIIIIMFIIAIAIIIILLYIYSVLYRVSVVSLGERRWSARAHCSIF